MRWLKRIAAGFLLLLMALAGWVYVGSIDDASFDDQGLLSELKPVPDAENGYVDISFLNQEEYDFCGVSTDSIRKYALGYDWNINHVDRLGSECKNIAESIKLSNKKPRFVLPERDKSMAARFFPYKNLTTANRLLIIQSRRSVQDFDYLAAVNVMDEAIMFAEHVRLEARGGLISWLVGAVMQGENLAWLHELSTNHEMPDDLQKMVLLELQKIKISNDGFVDSFFGEYNYFISEIEMLKMSSYSEKYYYYKEIESDFEALGITFSAEQKALLVLSLAFPSYYIHSNNTASRYVALIRSSMEKYSGYCPEIRAGNNSFAIPMIVDKPRWQDFIEPNSLAKTWLSDDFGNYFARRCLFQVYVDGVRAAVALRMYSENHGKGLPRTLEKLVPDYLDRLPQDYFGGMPMRYSPENEWLYSIGSDHKDDGGSPTGFYIGRCVSVEPCFNNPTIPLVARQAMH